MMQVQHIGCYRIASAHDLFYQCLQATLDFKQNLFEKVFSKRSESCKQLEGRVVPECSKKLASFACKLSSKSVVKTASLQTCCFDLKRPEPDLFQIGYTHCLDYNPERLQKNAQTLSNMALKGFNLHCVHAKKEEVLKHALQKKWIEFFDQAPSDAKFIQICHGFGTLHVKSALEHFPFQERMVVIATAPAAFIPKNTCTAYHLVIPGDPIPLLSSCQRMLGNKDKSVKILPPHLDGSHPHDPQGLSYQHEISKILNEQLKI